MASPPPPTNGARPPSHPSPTRTPSRPRPSRPSTGNSLSAANPNPNPGAGRDRSRPASRQPSRPNTAPAHSHSPGSHSPGVDLAHAPILGATPLASLTTRASHAHLRPLPLAHGPGQGLTPPRMERQRSAGRLPVHAHAHGQAKSASTGTGTSTGGKPSIGSTSEAPLTSPSPSPLPAGGARHPIAGTSVLGSRWRHVATTIRAAIANPAPDDQGLYDSVLASQRSAGGYAYAAASAYGAGSPGPAQMAGGGRYSAWGAGVGSGGGGGSGAGEDADDAAFLAALTHNGAGANLRGQRELDAEEEVGMDALHYAYPGANPAAPAEVRWRGKVYASSTDSVDEVVVDGLAVGVAANSAGAAAAAAVLPTPTVVRAEVTETLFYPPPPRSPPPRKPPDALRAVLWWVQGLGGLVGWARRTFWPALLRFFDLSFWSGEQEELYRRDSWFTSKQLAFTASLFYILNTILAISLIPRPLNLYNKITYFGVAPLLTVPITLMVLFNAPKFRWAHRLQLMYQPTLMLATWCWSWFSLWDMWACGYYETPDHPDCGNKDFLSTFYFSTALPVLALFALGQHRFYAALGAAAYLVIMCVLILPERTSWVRNVVNFMVFQAFLIYVHYMRETAERRIFILREQLKAQFKVTEKAQDLERRASDSKKRFVSYIFHEVRVPLNTALLAVQNLAPDILSYRGKDDIEFGALEGSLNMMSKVLNDVLDFNRMDSGRFESISSPFCFHNVIRTMLIPLELAAQARGLSVTTELDRRIDEEANRAAAAESGLPMPLPFGADEGWVLSDEMRLRQLVTNLTSNACKFTATGGKIHVRTTLVKGWAGGRPSEDGVRVGVGDGHADVHADGTGEVALELDAFGKGRSSGETAGSGSGSGSGGTSGASGAASPWRWKGQPAGRDSIVVRIEVEDTGVGIRPRDIMANQLFSPYVQTEIGRYQGGKGTGLGLALVRHIVKLSGGRLGVRSKVGRGSTFWVELALGVGKEAIVPLTERRELAGDDEGGFGAWPSTQPQVQQGVNGNGSGTETLTDPPAGRGMRIPMPPMGVVDPRAMEGATPSTQASTRSGLLDTPLSDDSAMRTILEHDGMFELTSRRAGGMPSPVGTIRSPEPAATKFDLPSPIPLGPILSKSSSSGEHDPSLQGLQPAKSDPSKPPPTPGDTPPNAARAAQAPPPQPPTPAEEPLPVLVVDDDHLTRRLMARLLTRLGCVADCAEDGSIALNMLLGPNTAARALRDDPFYAGAPLPVPPANGEIPEEQVDQYKYGVVFLDNQMPFYSGVQVVYKLRELGRDTFVVGVTGNALAEDQQEYLDAGVDRVLTKPVMEKDLRAMVALARNVRKKKLAAAKAEPKLPKSSTPSTSPTIRG